MPDDWKDGVRDIVDEWGLELSDTIAKDTNEEFVKRISTMGVEMNLVQTEALDKLVSNDIAFISKTNKQIGESIIADVEKLLIEKGDWASAKESVLKHVEDVFSGEEKIVINNIGKTSKRVFVDTALGHAVIKDVTVQRAWSGNIQAYSDMVAKSLSQKARQMGDIEAYRMTNGIVGWRRMSSLSGRTCNICASLHGRAYYFSGVGYNGMPDDDGMMFEPHPNGYCYQVPIYEEWTGIKNRSDEMLDADLDSWKIQNEHSMSNLVRVGQMPTDTVQTDFIGLDNILENVTSRHSLDSVINLPDDFGSVEGQKIIWDQLDDKGWYAESLFYNGNIWYDDILHVDKYDRIIAMSRTEIIGSTLHINDLEINMAMRRTGKGVIVMRDIISEAQSKGIKKVTLTSLDENSDKFYKALGMSQKGHEFSGEEQWIKEFLKESIK